MKRLFILLTLLMMVSAVMAPGMTTAQDEELSGELEIFTWWAGSDGGPAIDALYALYNEQHPDVEIVNAVVTGGAGTNAKAVLISRMQGGDPPDSFQVHAGQELIGTWVVADRMEDLTFLFEEEGWMETFPPDLIDLLSYEGGIYSVPANIHRSNVLWYVPGNLEEWEVEVPATWDDFLAACPTLQEADVTPLVIGEAWTVNHLWESVALGELGAENWNALWAGELDPAGEEMVGVWETFGEVLACSNISEDAGSLSWQQATDEVVNGNAAFNIMGDWAAGYLATTLELVPGEDYGWAASPGTEGNYMMLSDSFGLPADAPNRDNVVAWLSLLGSVEGQDAFNSLKGSLPARIDADTTNPELYNEYFQDAAGDWADNTIVGSLVHGVAANERFMNDFSSVIEIFLDTESPEAAAAAMAEVCEQSGACG